jgi:hypothetical protein
LVFVSCIPRRPVRRNRAPRQRRELPTPAQAAGACACTTRMAQRAKAVRPAHGAGAADRLGRPAAVVRRSKAAAVGLSTPDELTGVPAISVCVATGPVPLTRPHSSMEQRGRQGVPCARQFYAYRSVARAGPQGQCRHLPVQTVGVGAPLPTRMEDGEPTAEPGFRAAHGVRDHVGGTASGDSTIEGLLSEPLCDRSSQPPSQSWYLRLSRSSRTQKRCFSRDVRVNTCSSTPEGATKPPRSSARLKQSHLLSESATCGRASVCDPPSVTLSQRPSEGQSCRSLAKYNLNQ